MAGPDVGDIYLDTHANTKGLAAEVRRAAKAAGKGFGQEFTKGADQSLSGLGNRIRENAGLKRAGKAAAKEFRDALVDGVNDSSLDFDLDIAKAINTGDWSDLFKNLDDVDAQVDRINGRLKTLSNQGGFSKLGVTATDAKNQMAAFVAEAEKTTKVEQALRRNEKAMKDWTADIQAGQKAAERLARSTNLTESIRSMNQYGDVSTDTSKALRDLSTQVRALGKQDVGGKLGAQIKTLGKDTKALEDEFTRLGRTHRDSLLGMERDSKAYGTQVKANWLEVRGLSSRVQELAKSSKTIKTKVELETPPPGEVAAEGFALGKIFSSAFNRATSKGAKGDSFFKPLQQEWNQFLYAFPAEVTLLLRYFALIGSELATLGSGVGASLTALIGSLGSSILALGGAVAAVFPAMAYGIGLASQSMDVFESKFPETYTAVERLKDAFTKVDVPAFASRWSGSVRDFANTLAASLEGDKIAAGLGNAAAQVTAAFTGVISSPGWVAFVRATETTIPNALTGIGIGFANVFQALLPVLTAAAPLAETLGNQFARWAGDLATTANSAAGLSSLADFFDRAGSSLGQFLSLLGSTTSALVGTFAAGAQAGNGMITTLSVLAARWDAWTSSIAGQNALGQWFANGEQIFNALLPLLGAVGKMFADIVTPETVAQTVNFLGQLTQLTPALGQILGVLSNLDLLGSLATLANSVLSALQPLIPALTQIATAIGEAFGQLAVQIGPVIGQAVAALLPLFTQLAASIGPIIQALAPVIGALGDAFIQIAQAVGSALVPVFAALAPVIEQIAPVFAQLASTLGGVLAGAITAFAPVLAGLLPIVAQLASVLGQALIPIIAALAPVFEQIAPIVGQVVAMFAETLLPIIQQLAPLIAQLVPIIGLLAQAFMPIVQVVLQVVAQLASALMPVIQALIPIILQLAPAIVQLFIAFNPVLRVITLLLPVVMPLIQLLAQLVTWVLKLITPLAPLINYLVTLVAQFLGFNGAIRGVIGFVQKLIPSIMKVINVFKNFGTGMGDAIKAVSNFVGKATAGFGKFVSNVVTKIGQFISKITSGFTGLFSKILTGIGNFVVRAVTGWVGLFTKLGNLVSKGVTALVGWFQKLPGRVISAITSLVARMSAFWTNLFSNMGARVSAGLTKLVGWFKEVPDKLINALSGAGTLLLGVGEDIVNGLWQGMKNIFGSVTGWLGDQMAKLPEPVKKVLHIASPSKVFRELGRNIMQGLAQGMLDDSDDVVKAVTDVSKDVVAAQQDLVREEADRIIEARKKANDRIRAYNNSHKKDQNYLPSISRTEATKMATQNTKALRAQLAKTYDAVIKEQAKLSKGVATSSVLDRAERGAGSLNAYVKRQDLTLRDLVKARESAANKLDAANKKLSDAVKVRDDFAKQVRDQALSFASATSAAQTFGQKAFTAEDITDQMQAQLRQLRTFKADVATLTKQGLNKTTLRQITEAGVEGGSDLAAALVAGGKSAVSQTNTLQSKINTAAKGLGASTSRTFYQAGVDSAKALAAGITSQTKAITQAMTKLTDRLVAQVKRNLKIHSPSKVLMDEVGAPMGLGIVEGLDRQRPKVTNLLADIAATPVVVTRTVGNAAVAASGPGKHVTFAEGAIQVMPVQADPVLTAHAVLDRLALTLQ